MRRYQFLSFLPLLFLGVQPSASAQDVQVPAGTLLRCTLNEPDFSSKSAQVGDPVLCHASVVQEFGRAAFPRGAYLAGHLEADKEPGQDRASKYRCSDQCESDRCPCISRRS